MKISCFDPLITRECTVLILGTAPGSDSISNKEYYANETNHFWDIIVRILDPEWDQFQSVFKKMSYSDKTSMLLSNKVALWDVIQCCNRDGNRDSKITDEIINDPDLFLDENPGIVKIIFNGASAFKFYKKRFGANTFGRVAVILNSTSSTNPNNTFFVLEQWKNAIKCS